VTSESKLARNARRTVIALVFVFAIAAPIIVAVRNARDQPSRGPDGIKLTAAETAGRELFAKSCSTCHTLAAVNAVARIGPDLDVLRPPTALVLAAIQGGYAGPGGQMPTAIYSGQDANDVAQFVAAVAGR
jgi:mono/diheme cytochrome c family protein